MLLLPHIPAGTTQNENEEFLAEMIKATFMLHRFLVV
jgi:hypothetical protein